MSSIEIQSESTRTSYRAFKTYFESTFSEELRAFFLSYCQATNDSTKFLGFNRDHLTLMDTILINLHRQELTWPEEKHLAWFAMGLWSIAVTDIVIYSHFKQYAPAWEVRTHYPKLTGWNYYATEPSYLLTLITQESNKAKDEIEAFICDSGKQLVQELTTDTADLLKLGEQDCQVIESFLLSWLKMGTSEQGIEYDAECFLR